MSLPMVVPWRSPLGSIEAKDYRTPLQRRYNYHQVQQQVQQYLIEHAVTVPNPPWRRAQEAKEVCNIFLAQLLRALKERTTVADGDRQQVARDMLDWITGLGVLQSLIGVEGLQEIIVRNGQVLVEEEGEICPVYLGDGYDDAYFEELVKRIADLEGRQLGQQKPQVKLGVTRPYDYPFRLTATIPPVSAEGTALNVRLFTRKTMTFDDLLGVGACDEETVDFLKDVAREERHSVVFSGSPGSGKTTWLNAFSQHLRRNAQVSSVETFEELQLLVEHPHRLIVEEELQQVREYINLVILRMHPDVLIIGEIVGDEAEEYIMGLNLGIVTYTTLHASDAWGALIRLVGLARKSALPPDDLRRVIGQGLHYVVHLERRLDPQRPTRFQRYLKELAAVYPDEGQGFRLAVLKQRKEDGTWTPLREPRR